MLSVQSNPMRQLTFTDLKHHSIPNWIIWLRVLIIDWINDQTSSKTRTLFDWIWEWVDDHIDKYLVLIYVLFSKSNVGNGVGFKRLSIALALDSSDIVSETVSVLFWEMIVDSCRQMQQVSDRKKGSEMERVAVRLDGGETLMIKVPTDEFSSVDSDIPIDWRRPVTKLTLFLTINKTESNDWIQKAKTEIFGYFF